MARRVVASSQELDAEDLRKDTRELGATPIADLTDKVRAGVCGTVCTTTLRPRSGLPALEVELYDGSGTIRLIWLGRRSLAGVDPGRKLRATGRVSLCDGRPVMFNPRYQLHQRPHG
jgi:hypothetical protein